MVRLTDSDIFARYCQALADWAVEGAIVLNGRASDGLRTTLEGVTEKYFKEASIALSAKRTARSIRSRKSANLGATIGNGITIYVPPLTA